MSDTESSDETTSDEADRDEAAQLARTQAVVEHLAKSLVDEPEAVGTAIDLDHPTPRINVTAAPGEVGRLIGKRGRTAQAIRAVGRAAAAKDGAHVDVEFLD